MTENALYYESHSYSRINVFMINILLLEGIYFDESFWHRLKTKHSLSMGMLKDIEEYDS